MRFWMRELAGWALVGLGLLFCFVAYVFCDARAVFEAGIMAVVGVIIFRGGVHLLKVAVAARICLQAQDRLYPASVAPAPRTFPPRRAFTGGRQTVTPES